MQRDVAVRAFVLQLFERPQDAGSRSFSDTAAVVKDPVDRRRTDSCELGNFLDLGAFPIPILQVIDHSFLQFPPKKLMVKTSSREVITHRNAKFLNGLLHCCVVWTFGCISHHKMAFIFLV
jgi:hypothetical protein